ncbi:MAG: hypothetical protein N2109_04360 [Fimbriimonadales bacterium]|nr:hypothetical protein [Fimbriimonadales bacterium]
MGLRRLLAEASAAVEGRWDPEPRPHNAHIHLPPNFSAFDSVEDAVEQARSEGAALLGAANYYDYSVFERFASLCLEAGVFPLVGTEILTWMEDCAERGWLVNDPGNPGKAYLCGKALALCAEPTPWAASKLGEIREGDARRMERMVELVGEHLRGRGIALSLGAEEVRARVAQRHRTPLDTVVLQERHLAMALAERLASPEHEEGLAVLMAGDPPADPVALQNELRNRLLKAGRPAYVDERFVPFDEAARLIRELGGVPCYPAIMDGIPGGPSPFEDAPEELARRLVERGIPAIEFIPNRNDPAVLEEYALAARAAGLVATAGTEHNTLGSQPIVPRCKGGLPIPRRAAEIFWEGACVMAGHQLAVARGEPGFEEAPGTVEERIAAFRAVGCAAILEVTGRA